MAESITRKNIDLDILDYYDGKIKNYVDDKVGTGGLTIDDTLSDTSTNPVQNKVVKQAIDNKADKTVATTSADGLMSAEDKTKLDNADDTYALKSKYGDTTINVGRRAGTPVGDYSTAEGFSTEAGGRASHAEGAGTSANGQYSHAEGAAAIANGQYSHAEGLSTTASGSYSHAEGYYTTTTNESEHASGKYNQSNSDTLFSIGDGTADDARHNAFEITTTGGKLHDKDIATTDLIPTELPANGGDADTVDGKHAGDFAASVNPTITGSIKVVRPSSTSTIQSIFSISDTIRIRNLDSETSQTNNYADIIVTTSGVFTEKAINGVFQGRKELLTSTCVTGTSTIVDSNNFVSANFGFTPSAVLYAVYDSKTGIDDNYRLAPNFNSDGFITQTRAAPTIGGTETFSYIAFR